MCAWLGSWRALMFHVLCLTKILPQDQAAGHKVQLLKAITQKPSYCLSDSNKALGYLHTM